MKNFILSSAAFFAFAVLGTNTLGAQVTSNTATTTANIILDDVISIDAGSVANGGKVDFEYKTTADYNTDKTVPVPNSLKVISSTPFDVKVKAAGTDFENGSNKIAVGVLRLAVTNTTTTGGTPAAVTLSNKDQQLLSNANRSSKAEPVSVDISYTIPSAEAKEQIFGKIKGTYTQKVIYTATTK